MHGNNISKNLNMSNETFKLSNYSLLQAIYRKLKLVIKFWYNEKLISLQVL